MKKLVVLGTGETTSIFCEKFVQDEEVKILSFQGAFPNCYLKHKVVPDYWFSADPNSYVDGLKFLLSLDDRSKKMFKKMKIIVPSFCAKNFSFFRQFSGTTPLGRKDGAWAEYIKMLNFISEKYKVEIVDSLTTKYIKNYNLYADLDLFNNDVYIRFMENKPIFGTVPYDSDSVIGDIYKWGLENKLSSHVFPICYYLGYNEIYIAGFDFKGGRFYLKDDVRHPWNDETQKVSRHSFPLQIIKKWKDWHPYHNMNFYSAIEGEKTLLNVVLDAKNV